MSRALEPARSGAVGARELEGVESELVRAEQAIRLLDRAVPLNLPRERQRLRALFERGEAGEPVFEYVRSAELEPWLGALSLLEQRLAGRGTLGALYAERARELWLEATLATKLGSPDFTRCAAERYAFDRAQQPEVDPLVASWLVASERTESAELVAADDRSHAQSLWSVLSARIGALGLPIRIEVRSELSSVAAAGDGFVALRAGARLTASRAQRIACHELFGHVLPRLEARRESLGIFRVGARAANDEEEGRALLIEKRAHWLDGARRRELALRHRAAWAAREGASFVEIVALARDAGLGLDAALEIALRAVRGGGLGRELVYIPAYLRLEAAFAKEPALERYFERGRVALDALPRIVALEASGAQNINP